LLVGLHYLKHPFDESDESVVGRLLENPYRQYFYGFEFFIHRMTIDPSSMTLWHKWVLVMSGRYVHTQQMGRAEREQKKLENYLDRANRNILYNCPQPGEKLAELLHNAKSTTT